MVHRYEQSKVPKSLIINEQFGQRENHVSTCVVELDRKIYSLIILQSHVDVYWLPSNLKL